MEGAPSRVGSVLDTSMDTPLEISIGFVIDKSKAFLLQHGVEGCFLDTSMDTPLEISIGFVIDKLSAFCGTQYRMEGTFAAS